MFKTKDELIGNAHSFSDDFDDGAYIGRENAIDDAFNSFAERVRFYKKYRITGGEDNSFLLFRNEQPEIYKKYNEDRRRQPFGKLYFNSWLFDYCFGDIIKSDWDATIEGWGNSTVDMPD